MRFLTKDEIGNLPIEKQIEWWLSLFKKGETFFMFFEGFFFFILLLSFAVTIDLPPRVAWLGYIATGVIIIAGAGIILFLVALQQIAFAEFIKSWATPTFTDDIWKGIVTALIIGLFYWGDKKGGGDFLNYVNPYDAKITEKYEDDGRVSSQVKDINRLEKERDLKLNGLVFADSAAIVAQYSVKIQAQKGKLRKNEWDAAWKKAENDKIRNAINALEAERNAKILYAKSRFENKKDSVKNSYDTRIFSTDTALTRLKTTIDSSNQSELNKAVLKEEENKHYGGGLSILTQLGLLFCRFMQVRMWRKAGKEVAAIGEFMASTAIINTIFEWIGIRYNTWVEKFKITNSYRYAKAITDIEQHALELSQGSEIAEAFINGGVKNFTEAKMMHQSLMKKNEKKTVENDINVKENPLILTEENYYKDVIATFTMFYSEAEYTDPQKDYYRDVVDTFSIFLNDLKNPL